MEPKKVLYKVINWPEYNKILVKRGDIRLHISDDIASGWYEPLSEKDRKRGRQRQYSDLAIEFALTMKYMFGLAYRQTEGFVNALLQLSGIDARCPSHTQLCRRAATIEISLKRAFSEKKICDVAVDSTGLKLYGDGEWKARKHGVSKRRTWRKLHLAVDPETSEILAQELTENGEGDGDSQVFPRLMNSISAGIKRCFGDGAYDSAGCYEACAEVQATLIAPPQRGAVLQDERKKKPEMEPRDKHIRRIHALENELGDEEKARKQWKFDIGYHRRSLSENAMFRFKTVFGGELSARTLPRQRTEAAVKINILNSFTALGMPQSEAVAA